MDAWRFLPFLIFYMPHIGVPVFLATLVVAIVYALREWMG